MRSARFWKNRLLYLVMLAPLFVSTSAVAGKVELGGLRSKASHDQFIVRFKTASAERQSPAARQRKLDAVAAQFGLHKGLQIALKQKLRMATGADVVRVSRKLDREAAANLMRQIALDPNVEYVEVDARVRAVLTPNDPYYGSQWAYPGFRTQNGVTTVGINAEPAWNMAAGDGIVVAVIDTGTVYHHDFSGSVWGYDFITDPWTARDGDGREYYSLDEGDWSTASECDPYQPQSSWHGAHVSGIVAAYANNAKGVAGTAFRANVQPVRVLGRCGGDMSDVVDSIVWASGGAVDGVPANQNPAEVINLSLSAPGACGPSLQDAINSAVSRGTTVVVAAGNDNIDVANVQPASCQNVITVAAVGTNGDRSVWGATSASNYGQGVDIAAPGTNILSTTHNSTTVRINPPTDASLYEYKSGTSMAAPFVSGVVALIQSVAKTPRTPAQIESLLKATAHPFPNPQGVPIGTGILDAYAAVASVVATDGDGQIIGMGGKCLDAAGGGTGNGTPIQVWSCNGFSQQKWFATVSGAGLMGVPSGRNLDAVGYGITDGTRLQLWGATGASNQAWRFTNSAIVGVGGKVMDAVNGGSANGTKLQLWDSLGNPQQTWNFRPDTGAIYGIGGRCLELSSGGSGGVMSVYIWDCTGGERQKWALGANGSIVGAFGMCLEAAGSGNGSQLRATACNGSPNQRWFLRGEIRGVQSNKCLDDPSAGQADGSLVHLWTCHGGLNQRWEFHH